MQSTELPYTKEFTFYAMCDLHRIELILRTMQDNLMHGLSEVSELTKQDITRLDIQGAEVCCEWLRWESSFYGRKYGIKKAEKAVQFARASKHCRIVCAEVLTGEQIETLSWIEQLVASELEKNGVVIDDDLSFAERDIGFVKEEEMRLRAEEQARFGDRWSGGGRGGGRIGRALWTGGGRGCYSRGQHFVGGRGGRKDVGRGQYGRGGYVAKEWS